MPLHLFILYLWVSQVCFVALWDGDEGFTFHSVDDVKVQFTGASGFEEQIQIIRLGTAAITCCAFGLFLRLRFETMLFSLKS